MANLEALRGYVRAADEEFHHALAFYEAWRPTATDSNLHGRLGLSFATNTFNVIRVALRREVLLALMRIWDTHTHPKTLRMFSIADALNDQRTLTALEAECLEERLNQPIKGLEGEDANAARQIELQFGREQAAITRQRVEKVVALIEKYREGGSGRATFEYLKSLRNKRLAHRDIDDAVISVTGRTSSDEQIESLYDDTSKIIRLLKAAVEKTSYNPDETAAIHGRHAALFWASVRGERTVGHPNFKET